MFDALMFKRRHSSVRNKKNITLIYIYLPFHILGSLSFHLTGEQYLALIFDLEIVQNSSQPRR